METTIEKLHSTNYASWEKDVRVHLMDRNCWRNISEQEVKPADDAPAKEKWNFESQRDRAYSTIYLCIKKEYQNLISYSRLEEASGLFSTQHKIPCH
ncbi:UNVERIFIED_CONTAM: hypothetical protein NCL1_48762 [Trichonephila clavipes]